MPSPSPSIAPTPPLPAPPFAAALPSTPAKAAALPCTAHGTLPAAVRAPPQSAPSILLEPLPAHRPPLAESSPPARPDRALRPADPAPASNPRPNSHTTLAADSPPCNEISLCQCATHARVPASPFAAPSSATLSLPAISPMPGSSPPDCSAQPPAPGAPALARNSSNPSRQTYPPPAALLLFLPLPIFPGAPSAVAAPPRLLLPASQPTLPAPAYPATPPTAGKVSAQSSASPAKPHSDPPPPSQPPATGTSAAPRANHAPHPAPAPSAPLPAPSARAPSNTSNPAAHPVSRELCFLSPFFLLR